ncbi:Protein of unknown function [Bacillus cereus]|jgi:hypothetical protein
MTELK